MPLRRRLSLTVALVATAVVVFAGVAAWLTTRSVLLGNIDDTLRAQVQGGDRPRGGPGGARLMRSPGDTGALETLPSPPPRLGGPAEYSQALTSAGVVVTRGDVELPVTAEDRSGIRDGRVVGPRDVEVGDSHLRMITVPLDALTQRRLSAANASGITISALQFARPLNGVDRALRTLALALLAVGLLLVAVAAVLGRTVARRILRPVADLAGAAAHVEATGDLEQRLPVRSGDEVGELTRRFNGMLARLQGSRNELDRSMTEQRNLVADASHELRTPVTSLRTNAELLLEDDATIDAEERRSMLVDVRDQAEDLGLLVSDLIELARGDVPDHDADEPVALDQLVEECVVRARRDHRGVTFETTLAPLVVSGRPDRLARAISNLLNNAALHGAGGRGTVEVRVATDGVDGDGDRLWATDERAASAPGGSATAGARATVAVVDHGPGVPEAERVRIFDRFRRGDDSRERHGSGLGLAIVRQVAIVHHGEVGVSETPGGGATFRLTLPVAVD